MGLHDEEDMNAEYEKDLKDHKKAVTKHARKPAATRGKAPAKPRKRHQALACFCYKLHCNTMDNGNGCYVCEEAAADSDSPLFVRTEEGTGHRQCICEICECQCRKTFKEADRQKIATTRILAKK
jgi:hypothetical protein